jgi:hypothetical protein
MYFLLTLWNVPTTLPLDDRPKAAFNRVGLNGSDNVFALGMVDSSARIAGFLSSPG